MILQDSKEICHFSYIADGDLKAIQYGELHNLT